GAADRVGEPRRAEREQQRLPAVELRRHDVVPPLERDRPPVLRLRPLREPRLRRVVGLLVARLEEARQRAVRRQRHEAALADELGCLVERLERPVRRQPAFVGASFEQLPEGGHRLHILAAVATAAILTIGNEIVSGDIENTNGSWLAKRLEELGVSVLLVAAIPDEIDRIAAFVREETPRCDLLLVTGGLGGTPDDVTREGIAAAFTVERAEVPELAARLRARFTRDPEYAA